VTGLLDNLPAWPEQDHAEFGPVTIKPVARIQQLAGRFLGRNWVVIPHVTHQDEADVTDLELARKAWNAANPNAKATLLVPVMQAVVSALQAYPVFNTSLTADGKSQVWKDYCHIGVAIDTPNGLLLGVVRDCDRKTAPEIGAEVVALSTKARSKGLSIGEMAGGSMTISSLGHIGGTAFTPIVNAPEAAILGLSKLQLRPLPAADGGVAWRQMLPLSLSYDHRIINGADAARFTRHVAEALAAHQFA
jgi:pyruvate dehydrogenase E2 component (dihydrolipoamide acetyltransferase)